MTRRPAVTLMEVLIAMFIMAIGMMALMALFPVGAVSMAQALKDDRCAYASTMSENLAIATNVRYGDANVNTVINSPLPAPLAPAGLVYVDPYGVATGPLGVSAISAGIPRVSPTIVGSASPLVYGSQPLIDFWYSLPDDIGFNLSGAPDTSNTGGIVDRGRRYSFAYMLRRMPSVSSVIQSPFYSVQLYAVVYAGRPVNSLSAELTVLAPQPPLVPGVPTNGIVIPGTGYPIKRGGWILDSTQTAPGVLPAIANFNFYRVTNVIETTTAGTPQTWVEVQPSLAGPLPVQQITIMENVAEIFDKGYGWQQ